MGRSGEYRFERGGAHVYVVSRGLAVDLAVRLESSSTETDRDRGDPDERLPAPPACVLGAGSGTQETGDEAFDSEVCVEVVHLDETPLVQKLLASPTTRAVALELVRGGAQLRIDPGQKAWLTARFAEPSVLADTAQLERSLDRLVELRKSLPLFDASGVARLSPGCGCVLPTAVLAGLGVAGLAAKDVFPTTLDGRLELYAVLASVPLVVLLVASGWRRIRRTTASRAPLWGLTAAALMAAPMLSVVTARGVNALGDPSVRGYSARVVDSGKVHSQHALDTYWVDVTPWAGHSATVTVSVPAEQLDALPIGSNVKVYAGKGRLGFEWVREILRVAH